MNCYEIVQQNIIEKLKTALNNNEKFHWVKPWTGGANAAYSYVESKKYRGINQLLLDEGEYITYKKLCELQKKHPEYKIKKGAKKHPVFFYSFSEKEDEEGKVVTLPCFKYYSVFNIADIEGLPTKFPYQEYEHKITENVEKAIVVLEEFEKRDGLKTSIVKGSSRAYYCPGDHSITLPDITQFESMYKYVSTMAHEIVHSTSKSLGRPIDGTFGSDKYSKEELIAEIGAAMFCTRMHIEDDTTSENSVAYIQSWLSKLGEENIYFVVQAANAAQKAMDLIFNEMYENKDSEPSQTEEDIANVV